MRRIQLELVTNNLSVYAATSKYKTIKYQLMGQTELIKYDLCIGCSLRGQHKIQGVETRINKRIRRKGSVWNKYWACQGSIKPDRIFVIHITSCPPIYFTMHMIYVPKRLNDFSWQGICLICLEEVATSSSCSVNHVNVL